MSSMNPVLTKWNEEGKRWAEAILVKAQHSSPLPPGARLLVNEDGDMHGAISMGCVETDIREHLLQLLKGGEPGVVHYGAANEFTVEVGLSCGGEIDVLLRVQSKDDVWAALASRKPDQPAILLTRISPAPAGRQRILFPDGRCVGSLGNEADDRQAGMEAGPLWERGGNELLKLGDARVFAEYLELPPPLAIVGASPIAVALCKMAVVAGFHVIVVDPRSAYARADLFPDAERVIHQWPEEGLQSAGIDERWFVAILAHDPKLDLPAIASALRHHCRYIGLLGSRMTQEKRRAQLGEMGFSPDEMNRIHGPIGIRFGAVEPAEIAVSILAELIGRRRDGLT